jgi:hypothetical protein
MIRARNGVKAMPMIVFRILGPRMAMMVRAGKSAGKASSVPTGRIKTVSMKPPK